MIKALYGWPTSGNVWNSHLSHNLREIGFNLTRFDLDVWIRGCKGGYDYIGTHTDDVLVIAIEPTYIFKYLKETYIIKAFGLSAVHIGCKYAQFKKGDLTWWSMGSTTYIT